MLKKSAQIISIVFHPVLIPTLGFSLLLYAGFNFFHLTGEARRFILLVVLFTTGILPMLATALLALNPKFDISFKNQNDRLLPMLLTSGSYYLGFFLLNKVEAYPVFKTLLIASILVIVALMIVSLFFKISNHLAALGGLTGVLLALAFRTGINPVWAIVFVILASGVASTARLILEKNTFSQLLGGYVLGLMIMYLFVSLV